MNLLDNVIDESTSVLKNYLKGNDIIPVVAKILDPLLTLNVSSYLFERFYYKYHWLDVTDYKSLLNFFVKGDFIVPITLFFIVQLIFFLVSISVFEFFNKKITRFLNRLFSVLTKAASKGNLTGSLTMPASMHEYMAEEKTRIKNLFHVFFKFLLVSILYFLFVPGYGIILFILAISLLLVSSAVLVLGYSFFSVTAINFPQKTDSDNFHEDESPTPPIHTN